jgi:hypothetical protein
MKRESEMDACHCGWSRQFGDEITERLVRLSHLSADSEEFVRVRREILQIYFSTLPVTQRRLLEDTQVQLDYFRATQVSTTRMIAHIVNSLEDSLHTLDNIRECINNCQ